MPHRPLRVLYAFDNRVPSAQADTEQLVSNASALSRRDLDLTLLIPRLGAELEGEAIREFYKTSGAFGVARYTPVRWPRVGQKLWAALRVTFSRWARDADVLYTRNLPVAVVAAARGHRVVFETYRPWPDQYPVLRPIIRRLMRSPSFVGGIFHSELARDSHARVGAPPDRLLVAHNGYEPSRMLPVLSRRAARERLDLPADRPLAVYTGRVAEGKGLDVILEMAGRCPKVSFLFVGGRGVGPFERALDGVANVSLAPWQPYDAISDWLYAADVLVVPPSSAPLERHGHTVLPIKLFSYLAAGRPILAPATPDVRELLEDERNALLVPPGNAEHAAESLQRVLGDAEVWARLAEGALDTAKGLTWDARAERIHDFISRPGG